jgi:hypothetical protein
MAQPLPTLALLALSLTALADRGFPSTTRDGADPGTAPNPDLEEYEIVDLTPNAWGPLTGEVVTEGQIELTCLQEDLLMNGTQGRTRGIASVQPMDFATGDPTGDWEQPQVCVMWQGGWETCSLYLSPGLWRFRCETDLPTGVVDVNPSNDMVEELFWVSSAG